MVESRGREVAIKELKTALKTEDEVEKDFRIRQALQLLKLDGEGNSDRDGENRDVD